MPFLLPNQQHQSTEGNSLQLIRYKLSAAALTSRTNQTRSQQVHAYMSISLAVNIIQPARSTATVHTSTKACITTQIATKILSFLYWPTANLP